MLKALFICLAFMCGGLVIVLTPLAWGTLGGKPTGGGRGFDEHVAFALAFGVVFVLAGTVGFGLYLLIRRWLVGPGLPERALLLTFISSFPPFILFQLGVLGVFADRIGALGIRLPVAVIMLPMFVLLSGCSGALVFGLVGNSKNFLKKANG